MKKVYGKKRKIKFIICAVISTIIVIGAIYMLNGAVNTFTTSKNNENNAWNSDTSEEASLSEEKNSETENTIESKDESKSESKESTVKENINAQEFYGKAIKYNIDLDNNGNTADDWLIFYNDTVNKNTFLISRDCVKNNYVSSIMSTTETYQAYWSSVPNLEKNDDMYKRNFEWFKLDFSSDNDNANLKISKFLLNTDLWDMFLTDNLKNIGGGVATGAPTLEMWCASWNEKYGESLSYSKTSNGYQIGESNMYTDLSSKSGYHDTLYFPHQNKYDEESGKFDKNDEYSYGYWLASPSDLDTFQVMRVDNDGYLYSSSYTDDEFGIRPVVMVPSDLIEKDEEGNYFVNDAKKLEIKTIVDPNYWTNTDVTLELSSNAQKVMYSLDEKGEYSEYKEQINVTENSKYYIKLYRGAIEDTTHTITIRNIDKNNPIEFKVNKGNENYVIEYNSCKIPFYFKDDVTNSEISDASGLAKIKLFYRLKDSGDTWTEKEFKDIELNSASTSIGIINGSKIVTIDGVEDGLDKGGIYEYYAIAYDVAGNSISYCDEENPDEFETKKYKIKYDQNTEDEVNNMPEEQSKYYAENIYLSDKIPEREGYDFVGWSENDTATEADFASNTEYKDNENINLYAVWKKKVYTITFDDNGGEGGPGNVDKIHGEDLIIPDNEPTREGYEFKGWTSEKDSRTVEYQKRDTFNKNENTTLYAIWQEKIYEITLDSQGADDGGINYEGAVKNFSANGQVNEITLNVPGTYKLEAWGAQGGSVNGVEGGKGGYSCGELEISGPTTLYVTVGSSGDSEDGGYNGGGKSSTTGLDKTDGANGGGATHIATMKAESGLLKDLVEYKDSVLLVAGGGRRCRWKWTKWKFVYCYSRIRRNSRIWWRKHR